MNKKLKKYKWEIYWTLFGVLVILFVFIAIYFEGKSWIANALQAIGTITGVYSTIIVFLKSKEDSDKKFFNHVEHLQNLNSKHIEALNVSTEKQIKAINDTTSQQISSFEQQIKEVTNKLSENSTLLAEILCREIEKSIEICHNEIKQGEAEYKTLSEFKFLRTPSEKQQELNNLSNYINQKKSWQKYLIEKHKQVKDFLNPIKKKINE